MIFCDGFSNNKESGFTVCDEQGRILVREVFAGRRTNNEAELKGVLWAAQHSIDDTIVTDSQVVTFWVRAGKCSARPDLSPIAAEIRSLLHERRVKLVWQPREKNLAGIYNEEMC